MKTTVLIDQIPVYDWEGASDERRALLEEVAQFIVGERASKRTPILNFICTHNSRRSQLSQAWAYAFGVHYDVPIEARSGGSEVTAFHPNAVAALREDGFSLQIGPGNNPMVHLTVSEGDEGLDMYSKKFDVYPIDVPFAAIMTCSDADVNCPYVPGATARIPLKFEDPKVFDGTNRILEGYVGRSREIASELKWIFERVNQLEA